MLSKRLKFIREMKGLKQKDVADKLNLSLSSYAGYEQGTQLPRADTLSMISILFNVSSDFLLGIEQQDNLNTMYDIWVILNKLRKLGINIAPVKMFNNELNQEEDYLMFFINGIADTFNDLKEFQDFISKNEEALIYSQGYLNEKVSELANRQVSHAITNPLSEEQLNDIKELIEQNACP